MTHSLRLRLTLISGILLLVFVILSGLTISSALHHYTKQAEHQRLQGLIYGLLAGTEVDEQGGIQLDHSALPETRLLQADSGLFAFITRPGGEKVWQSLSSPAESTPPQLAAGTGEWAYEATPHPLMAFGFEWIGDNEEKYPFTLLIEDRASPLYSQQRSFSQRLWLGLGSVAVILLLTLLGLFLWGLQPLQRVSKQLDAIRAGECDRIDSDVPSEIKPLTDSINNLLLQERNRQTRYRNAVDDLAHSLKTPLAILKARDTNHSKVQDDPLHRIDQIINYQLQKASVASTTILHPPISLDTGLTRTASALQKVYAEKNLRFRVDVDPDASFPMDEGDWMEVCGNLLDNAAKHAMTGVDANLETRNGRITLNVADDGPGFGADPMKLLARGKRADTASPGQGIGLAMIADIAASYGLELKLGQSDTGGASVSLTFPPNTADD